MYQSPEPGTLHECENCGAELPAPDEHGTRRCSFCGAVYAAPAIANAPPQINVTFGGSDTTMLTPIAEQLGGSDFRPINETPKTSGRGCLVTLVILALVAGIGIFSLVRSGTSLSNLFANYRVTGDTAVVLANTPSGPIPFVTEAYSGTSSDRVVVKLDGQSSTPVWTSDAFTDVNMPIATDATGVYVADKTHLVFLRANDGKAGWTATLPDEVVGKNVCKADCLKAIDAYHVMVETKDGELLVYDSLKGTQVWKRTLQDTSAPVYVMGSQLLVIDGKSEPYSVTMVDAATGADSVTFSPVCTAAKGSGSDGLSGDTVVSAQPDEHAVYLGFGFINACWQKWDVSSGTMVWSSPLPDDVNPSSGSSPNALVVTPTIIYDSYQNQVFKIDRASGAFSVMLKSDDGSTLQPLGIVGEGTLLVRSKSTRGTTKYSVFAWDTLNDTEPWTLSIGTAAPADPPGEDTSSVSTNEQRFTLHIDGSKIWLITADGNSKTFLVTSVNPKDGSPAPATAIDPKLGSGSYDFDVISWQGSRVLLHVDYKMIVIDAATNSQTYSFP